MIIFAWGEGVGKGKGGFTCTYITYFRQHLMQHREQEGRKVGRGRETSNMPKGVKGKNFTSNNTKRRQTLPTTANITK